MPNYGWREVSMQTPEDIARRLSERGHYAEGGMHYAAEPVPQQYAAACGLVRRGSWITDPTTKLRTRYVPVESVLIRVWSRDPMSVLNRAGLGPAPLLQQLRVVPPGDTNVAEYWDPRTGWSRL